MKAKSIFFLISIFFFTVVSAFPLKFYISNVQAAIEVKAFSLALKAGYPYSSLTLGNDSYLKAEAKESTSTFYFEGGWGFFKAKNISLLLGAQMKMGVLENALSNDRIQEIGRGYAWFETNLFFKGTGEFDTTLSYSRFLTSVEKNVSKDMVFLSPPNVKGEEANKLNVDISYVLDIGKGFSFGLVCNTSFPFSDAFIFSSPNLEIGIFLSTTTEELQKEIY